MNAFAILVAAFIPLVIGAIWYNEKVFGKAWMKASGMTVEKTQSGNMLLIFGLTFVLGLLAAFELSTMVVHQSGVFSLLLSEPGFDDPNSEVRQFFDSFMEKYGDKHRTFGHGSLHGGIAGFFMALPIIGIVSLFERKSWKYIAIHAGYWVVTFALMGGLISAWKA
jgi:hypothetical protein